jgi:hypothetical protein
VRCSSARSATSGTSLSSVWLKRSASKAVTRGGRDVDGEEVADCHIRIEQ